MKKLIVIALMTMLIACKKKDVTPEPQPDPVPVCQTGITAFPGTYIDQNASKITIVFLKNNCPTKNSNTYRIDGLAAAINKQRPGAVYEKAEYTMISNEYENGYASMNGGPGQFVRQVASKGDIAFLGLAGSSAGNISLNFKKEE